MTETHSLNIFKNLFLFLKNNFKTIFTFLSVGAITAIIYFSIFLILWKLFSFGYHWAVSIAYVISVTFYFFANRNLTFKAVLGDKRKQIFKYILMLAFSYLVTMFIISVCVEKFSLSPIIGTFFSLFVTTGLNFLVSKYWVFKQHENNQTCGVNS